MFNECIAWIDLLELPPNPACFLEFSKVTKGRSEKGTGKIGLRHQQKPLLEQSSRCFVLFRKEICHTEEVEDLRA